MAFKFELQNCHRTVSSCDVVDLVSIQDNLVNAWSELTDVEQNIKITQDLMFNAQRSISLLRQFGDSMIPQLNLDKGLEELIGIKESSITSEMAIEGLVDSVKDGIKKFVAYVKELFTKIRIWIKNFISKLLTRDPLLRDPLSNILKKMHVADDKVKEVSSGVLGPKLIQNVVQFSNQIKSCRSAVVKVVESKTDEDLEKWLPAIFFDSCVASSSIIGHLFDIDENMTDDIVKRYTSSREYVRSSDKEYNAWMDNSDSKSGVTINDIVSLETAQKSSMKSEIEFSNEVDIRLKSLISRLEKLDDAGDEYKLLRKIVMGLTNASKCNTNFYGAIVSYTVDSLKVIQEKLNSSENGNQKKDDKNVNTFKDATEEQNGYYSSLTRHLNKTPLESEIVSRVRGLIVSSTYELYDKGSFEIPIKMYDEAKLVLDAQHIEIDVSDGDFEQYNAGMIDSDRRNWNVETFSSSRSILRHAFCKKALDQCVDVAKYLRTTLKENNPQKQDIPDDLKQAISDKDVISAKSTIIGYISPKDKNYRNIVKYADLAHKSIPGGIYSPDNDDYKDEKSWKVLRASLREDFTRSTLVRIVALLDAETKTA